ncbi:MAG: hypothetical protein ABII75_08200 [Candidatus Omnitrophota bacterium]
MAEKVLSVNKLQKVFGGRVSWAHLFLSLGLTLLYIFLSCLFFKLTYRHALNSGLIARYSAENLG